MPCSIVSRTIRMSRLEGEAAHAGARRQEREHGVGRRRRGGGALSAAAAAVMLLNLRRADGRGRFSGTMFSSELARHGRHCRRSLHRAGPAAAAAVASGARAITAPSPGRPPSEHRARRRRRDLARAAAGGEARRRPCWRRPEPAQA